MNFIQPILLRSYQIKAQTESINLAAIVNWTLSVSFDLIKWDVVSSPPHGFPGDTEFNLSKPSEALFARIDGNSA